jgi:hypothetical protein
MLLQVTEIDMKSFIVRIELHGASRTDYESLHGFMAQEGFARSIRGGNGIVYKLPPAEYHIAKDATIDQIRESACRAANKTKFANEVLAVEYNYAAWSGLSAA